MEERQKSKKKAGRVVVAVAILLLIIAIALFAVVCMNVLKNINDYHTRALSSVSEESDDSMVEESEADADIEEDAEIEEDFHEGVPSYGYIIPPVLVEADFKYWTGLMSKDDSLKVKEYYLKLDINKLPKKYKKEDMLRDYPIMEETIIYRLRPVSDAELCERLEGCFLNAGYSYENYKSDCELDKSQK